MPGRRVFLLLGMHRSGTSMLARAVAACGIGMGQVLRDPAADNLLGYWEHPGIVAAQEALLRALLPAWTSPEAALPLPAGWQDSPPALATATRLAEILAAELATTPGAFACKDPRTALLLPLWQRVFERLGIAPRHVLVVRHPAAVAASLLARDNVPPLLGEALWLRHHAAILAAVTPDHILGYEAMLADPATALAGLAAALGTAPPEQPGLLRPALRHHAQQATLLPQASALHAVLTSDQPPAAIAAAAAPLLQAHDAGLALLAGNPGWLRHAFGWRGGTAQLLPLALPDPVIPDVAAQPGHLPGSGARLVLRHANAWCRNEAAGFSLHANAPGAAPVRLEVHGLPPGRLRFGATLSTEPAAPPLLFRLLLLDTAGDALAVQEAALPPGRTIPVAHDFGRAGAGFALELATAPGAASHFHAGVGFAAARLEAG